MVTQGIMFGHIVSSKRIEIDKSTIESISNLPTPKCLKMCGHSLVMQDFTLVPYLVLYVPHMLRMLLSSRYKKKTPLVTKILVTGAIIWSPNSIGN